MHRRSVSSDYHLGTQQVDHRGSFSSMSSSPQYYTSPSTPNLHQQQQQQQQQTQQMSQLPPPPPNTTQKPAHTNTFVHKLYK